MTASRGGGGLVRSIQTLYEAGSLAGLDDAELLGRFLDRADGAEAAFEAILARHGAMVHQVCRSAAGSDADAEDAFQATFLILACRAPSVRRRASLAPWLFGVARRVAARARANSARRRVHEHRAGAMAPTVSLPPDTADDLAILIEELDRLPARYRDPIVLCHLQGLTYEAASRQLQCPLGTLGVRLKRGKERLRARLERRGVSDPARALAPLPPPFVPVALSTATARLATLAASALGAGVPIPVLNLTQGALRTMRISKLIGASVALLALAAGAWTWNASAADDKAAPSREAFGARSPTKYRLTGRVADPDTGEPIAGATVEVFTSEPGKKELVLKSAQSGADGVYSVDLPPGHCSMPRIEPAPGCYVLWDGLSFTPFAVGDAAPVARRDYPMRRGATWEFQLAWAGDGRPAAHGRIFTGPVRAVAGADGVARMGLPRTGGEIEGNIEAPRRWDARPLGFSLRWDDGFRPEAVRSVERLDGSDRYRLMDGEGRSAQLECKEGGHIQPRLEDGRMAIHVALPSSEPAVLAEVGGTVVDRSGDPVSGALVEAAYVWRNENGSTSSTMIATESCRATTDERGRYRLDCMPDAVAGAAPTAIRLLVSKEGFVGVDTEPLDVERGKPATFPDVLLAPGCSVVGTVVDVDGRPVEGAQVENHSRQNPRVEVARTDASGRFRFDGLAEGPASLSVRCGDLMSEPGQALRARRDPEPVTIRLVPVSRIDDPAPAPRRPIL
ncbi:sigma-70 family RNA polymerase sigma factor [Planctomyces sp. SH-PL62]|uniref:sigma-70 family RNA polymerase sigma factor n=1 Tax=Planctomyces sp. SH-PL62 TaxID=1636152 RepID=UPI00078EBA18|nr:sigma-70 family RNA polymerase sigma factor [Planctomyces sp. SH-PL62]AMV37437.1 ECF RNA polymerase sigma factor SigW [Planctomyces sp. SH-PL62]